MVSVSLSSPRVTLSSTMGGQGEAQNTLEYASFTPPNCGTSILQMSWGRRKKSCPGILSLELSLELLPVMVAGWGWRKRDTAECVKDRDQPGVELL